MDWLSVGGANRNEAVQMAASRLLATYRASWSNLAPIELHRLASTLDVRIVKVPTLEGGARLLPTPGGFRVLVDATLPVSKQRMSIAHELVHTLFYERHGDMPVRCTEHTVAEEHFCFDVGRRILAPLWMIETLGITNTDSPRKTFETLVSKMKLSRPVAAQVMFHDRQLHVGVAGTWIRQQDRWSIQTGKFSKSPRLSNSDLSGLKSLCRAWLSDSSMFTGACHLWQYPNGSEGSAFVVAAVS